MLYRVHLAMNRVNPTTIRSQSWQPPILSRKYYTPLWLYNHILFPHMIVWVPIVFQFVCSIMCSFICSFFCPASLCECNSCEVIGLLAFIQSNLYVEVTVGTHRKWPFKTGDLLKELQFIWNFLWRDKRKVTV